MSAHFSLNLDRKSKTLDPCIEKTILQTEKQYFSCHLFTIKFYISKALTMYTNFLQCAIFFNTLLPNILANILGCRSMKFAREYDISILHSLECIGSTFYYSLQYMYIVNSTSTACILYFKKVHAFCTYM